MPLIRFFWVPLLMTVIGVTGAIVLGGPEIGLIVAVLCILEISISFDNAIVNAAVLRGMSERWQRIFLTWGILIAVFGMRLVFPIVIVAVAAGLGLGEVIDQALNKPDLYAQNLKEANTVIAAFGGTFLLMVFLDFFFDSEKDEHWVGGIERPLSGLGRLQTAGSVVAVGTLLLISQVIAPELRLDVLVAGLAGMLTHLIVSGLASAFEPDEVPEDEAPSARDAVAAAGSAAAKGGLASFLYLEVLDASFSFDGVIGAFAISTDILVIATGLGVGAFYIRTLTVYLVRRGTLSEYRYLEHGAHWAIGVLAVVLFVGIEHHVPEVITGLAGATLILAAFISSIVSNRRDAAASTR